MKKLLSVSIIILFYIQSIYSQSGWVLQESGQTYWNLNSVCFLNTNTGFAAGNNGILDKTTNGGLNWVIQNTGTNNWFTAMSFPTQNIGYIISSGGVLAKTTNGGMNWNLYSIGTNNNQTSIFFLDVNTGYTVSSINNNSQVFKTTNGGLNWLTYNISSCNLYSIFFINYTTGFGAGTTLSGSYIIPSIYKTLDGGNNWYLIFSINVNSLVFRCIKFCNSLIGYSVGSSGMIYKTSDGGNNWNPQNSNTGNLLDAIYFIDINTGYVAGTNGIIVKTTNGGSNWTVQQNLATSYQLNDIWFTDVLTGYAVGFQGTILKTTNGGELVGIQPKTKDIPKSFSLSQNYPNPFNPSTKIKYQIPNSSFVKMIVYDVLSKEVAVLVNEKQNPGTYEVNWDASNSPSGVYFYKLTTESFTQTKRMVLIK